MIKYILILLSLALAISCNKKKDRFKVDEGNIKSITFDGRKPSLLIEKDSNVVQFGFDSIRVVSKTMVDTLVLLNTKDSVVVSKESVRLMADSKLSSKYLFSSHLSPTSLSEDFDGDLIPDLAVLIQDRLSKKVGVVIFHSDSIFHVLGSGKSFNDRLDDISTFDEWFVDKNKNQYFIKIDSVTGDILGEKEVQIENLGIEFREFEGSGGLIYWDGKKYNYIHKGD